MSNCSITIKIGDQIITLDPGADIKVDDLIPLASTMSADSIRAIYGQLKDNLSVDTILSSNQQDLIDSGKEIYQGIIDNSQEFTTLLKAIKTETDPNKQRALVAYASSLDAKEVIEGDNFFIDPMLTYKASAYSPIQIRDMAFAKDGSKVKLFNSLFKLPGMNTLKMSIAYASKWKGEDLTRVRGAYISPDNIIQIVVPALKQGYQIIDDDKYTVTGKNLGHLAKSQIQDTILHELLHAVYSESYYSDQAFKDGIDSIHQAFLNNAKKDVAEAYANPQEFIAATFEDRRIQNTLGRIKLFGPNEDISAFDMFSGLISPQNLTEYAQDGESLQDKHNLLRDYIALTGKKLDSISKQNFFTANVMNVIGEDIDNILYNEGIDASEEDAELSSRDQYDSRYSVNRKAVYANNRFQDRWNRKNKAGKSDTFVRDTYYNGTKEKPSYSELDRLKQDDIALLPWLDYQKAQGRPNQPGYVPGKWVEVGPVVDKDGKLVLKNGKMQILPIVRDDKGEVMKGPKGQIIAERTQAFPIMYSNMKKQHVVVAKTTLKQTDEFNRPANNKFNTVSFPYDLVRGIRTLDRTYFDHNRDFEKELEDAKKELDRLNVLKGKTDEANDKKFDETNFYESRVQRLEQDILKAAAIKDEMVALHREYGFSHKDGDNIIMNVTKEAYLASTYSKENVDRMIFPSENDAVFVLDKSNFRTKDDKEKFRTYPNPRMFDLFWGDKEMSKDFVRSSEFSEAVAAGDLVRANSPVSIPIPGKKNEYANIRMNQWLTVYKKVANGIMVTTEQGTGFIIPFNNISGYAKNRKTEDYKMMIAQYEFQNRNFSQDIYTTKTNGKPGYAETVNFRALQYDQNKFYNPDKDADQEASVKRFQGNVDYIKSIIKTNESFIRVNKRFTNQDGERVNYQVNGLVIGKSEDGLLLFNETRGSYSIDYIRWDDKLSDKDKGGAEMMFYMENQKKLHDAWDEYQAEQDSYAKNKEIANFVSEKGKYTKVNEPRLNPHKRSDEFDFYTEVNGITLDRLSKAEGAVISLKLDKSKMTPEQAKKSRDMYERKVIKVLDNGTVVVAEMNTKDKVLPSGFRVKAGTPYARYVPREQILRIGFKFGDVEKKGSEKNGDFQVNAELNQDIVDRRMYLYNRSKVDRDFNNFSFAATKDSIAKMNNKPIDKDKDYWRFVPLTNIILEPQSREDKENGVKDEREVQFLDKDFKPVEFDKAAHVIATFEAGTANLKYVNRGIMVGTKMFYKDAITYKDSDGKTKWKQAFLDAVMPGDWVTTKNAKGEYWDAIIERKEGQNLHVLATDLTTDWVNPSSVYGVRLSKRNDRYSNFKRPDNLLRALELKKAQTDAVVEKQRNTKQRKAKPNTNIEGNDAPFSLDNQVKSPKASRRALLEIGNRMQALNPDVKINYLTNVEIRNLAKLTGHDYGNARAFVFKGEVNINMEKASVSDVIHEYAHLFLHGLKYSNPGLYDAVIGVTNNHSWYNQIAETYSHLDGEDLNEEVFVTVLGEYLNNKLKPSDKKNMDDNSDTLLDFASYAKESLTRAFNRDSEDFYDIDPKKILSMSFEDVINLVGDQLMNNKITDVNRGYHLTSSASLDLIVKSLVKQGLLISSC